MLSMSLIVTLLVIIALGWFWHDSLGVRERANRAAQDACERMQLQFLDGTVAFAQLKLARNEHGALTLCRTYVFDYTAGSIERRQGFVVFAGHRLQSLGFDNHAQRLHATEQSASPAARLRHTANDTHETPSSALDGSAAEAGDNKVLDLNAWRARRQSRPPPPAKQSQDTWQ